MIQAEDSREKELRLLEAGFTPAAVYVGVSLALAGILVTGSGFKAGANPSSYAVGCLLLSAVLFFFVMDFTGLAMWYEERRPSFGIIINALFGLGQTLIAVGVSLSTWAIGFRVGAIVFLSVYIAGFVGFNVTRQLMIGLEDPVRTRLTLRAINFLVLVVALIAILN